MLYTRLTNEVCMWKEYIPGHILRFQEVSVPQGDQNPTSVLPALTLNCC